MQVSLINMNETRRAYSMTNRAAKAAATRQRIRHAAMALYRDRPIAEFTLDEVAARAGTTVQTVLRIFGSKDQLMLAALHDLAAGGTLLKPTRPGDCAAAVAAVFDIYETIGDLLVKQLTEEERRPLLKPLLERGRANHRQWTRRVFAPQIDSRPDSEQLWDVLAVATDVYVWKLLRRDRGLSRQAAQSAVLTLVRAVTQMEASDGTDSLVELVGRRQPPA